MSWNRVSLPEVSVQRSCAIMRSAAPASKVGNVTRQAPAIERDQERQRGAGDVEERPAVEVAVVRPDAQALADRPGVAQHVVVGEHHGLRIGGRAGGELDQQEIARPHVRGEPIELAIADACAERQEIVPAPAGGRNLVADDDHVLQERQGRARQHAVDRGLGGAQEREKIDIEEAIGQEQRLHVGLREAEGELGRLEARVDRHRDGTERRGRIEQRHPVLVVAHQDADEIAAPHAERMHRLGGAAHRVACAR